MKDVMLGTNKLWLSNCLCAAFCLCREDPGKANMKSVGLK